MKKILLVVVVLFLASACSNNLKNIKISDLEKKLDSKDTFILCLSDEDESGKTLRKTLEKVSKDNELNTFFINTGDLKDEDEEKLKSLFTYEESNVIIFVKEGVENSVLSRITDTFISKEDLKNEIKLQGYLK